MLCIPVQTVYHTPIRRWCQSSPDPRSVVAMACVGWLDGHCRQLSACGVCHALLVIVDTHLGEIYTYLKVKPTKRLRPIFSSLSAILSSASCFSSTSLYLAMSFSLPKSSK